MPFKLIFKKFKDNTTHTLGYKSILTHQVAHDYVRRICLRASVQQEYGKYTISKLSMEFNGGVPRLKFGDKCVTRQQSQQMSQKVDIFSGTFIGGRTL